MGPGVTDLRVFTICGGVEIIVPPGLNVESHGVALLGGFDHVADSVHSPDPHAPTLRITGVALMGGVDVRVRHPGERNYELPFGTFLGAGAIVAVLYGNDLIRFYLEIAFPGKS